MQRPIRRVYLSLLFAVSCFAQSALPPRVLTWQETLDRFRANNPSLLAGKTTVDESRAQEITAYLRPNPVTTLGWDQLTPYKVNGELRPIWLSYAYGNTTYLHEREHKRELRLASAQRATAIATSGQADLERNLTFGLRDAFVRLLQAKAVEGVAKQNIDYYDKELGVYRDRLNSGAISRVDFQRVELQRVQFESDLLSAQVDVRTAKIDLLTFLRDSTPVDQFDINANFDFVDQPHTLEELRQAALGDRPDLKQADQVVDKARTDHQLAVANGSADPTFGGSVSWQPPPYNTYAGFSITIPLRIFDKNQGEKARTSIDITRTERLRDAAQSGVLRDVDSAYATLENTLQQLRPYKQKYLREAQEIRDTVTFAYQNGAASLLEFLDAQRAYRETQLSYLNLVGAYMAAANQVNFAVGHEVIQ
jgi:cobalt-zinc-cadmium efflux system outer membrane protein